MKKKYIQDLKSKIQKINDLKTQERFSSDYKSWKSGVGALLERMYGKNNRRLSDFEKIRYNPMLTNFSTPKSTYNDYYKKGLENAEGILNSVLEELENYGIPEKKVEQKESGKGVILNNNLNLSNVVNIDISNSLKNNLTVNQFEELQSILKIENTEERNNKLTDFLTGLGSAGIIEILKSLLIGA